MKVLPRSSIIDLINNGKVIIIYNNNVLNLTPWLPYHPGGDKAVLHMIGRDATDEMLAYHCQETVDSFLKYRIGIIDYPWENLLPPIQGGNYGSPDLKTKVTSKVPQNVMVSETNKNELFPITPTIVDPQVIGQNYDNSLTLKELLTLPQLDYTTQNHLRQEYNKLHSEIIKLNFYQCDYWHYIREVIKLGSMFLYAVSLFKLGYLSLSAIMLGLTWQQGTFIAHDAGHLSISHDYYIDNVFGIIIADFFGGLSLGWWKKNHNVHHLITNDPVHDPDIQHLPFFAVSTRLFTNVYSTYYDKILEFDAFAKFLIPFQKYLYYVILSFGRFNLYRLSWTYLIMGESPKKGKASWFRYLEFVGLSFFTYWYFYLWCYKLIDTNGDRFKFLFLSNFASFIVHVQITLSHFAMSTADYGVSESFVMRQLRTTMDVDCPKWFDFFHGGLQFQSIHHLFPRLPRHNLRDVQPLVIKFCDRVGLKYSIYGFGKGNEIVISKLGEIGKQCRIMLEAAEKFGLEDYTP